MIDVPRAASAIHSVVLQTNAFVTDVTLAISLVEYLLEHFRIVSHCISGNCKER